MPALSPQRAPGHLHLRVQPCRASLAQDLKSGRLYPRERPIPSPIRQTHIQVNSTGVPSQRITGEQDALDAGRPAHAWRRRTPQLPNEPVIASATADAALRAEGVARKLEDRARVVVQAAHKRRIDLVGHASAVE